MSNYIHIRSQIHSPNTASLPSCKYRIISFFLVFCVIAIEVFQIGLATGVFISGGVVLRRIAAYAC